MYVRALSNSTIIKIITCFIVVLYPTLSVFYSIKLCIPICKLEYIAILFIIICPHVSTSNYRIIEINKILQLKGQAKKNSA